MYGFCPLASGSQGNSIYFGTPQTKILVDAGLSLKLTQERLAQIDVDLSEIQAILISHEHADHIQGLKRLALQLSIPVFANVETAKGICAALQDYPKFKLFCTGEPFEFGDLEISPFTISHDTLDPVAFTIRTGGVKVGLCTDLGFASTLVKRALAGCDYLYVEANHQPSMVHASNRSKLLKERILSRNGHLSNEACGTLLAELLHPKLRHVHLAHLSSECNSPKTALEVVRTLLGEKGAHVPVTIAPQETLGFPISFSTH